MADLEKTCEHHRTQADAFMEVLRKLRSLASTDDFPGSVSIRQLEDLESDLHRFRKSECEPRYQVAVAGGFGVGKSHLINGLLGEVVLIHEMQDTTFLPTVVCKSTDGHSHYTAKYLTANDVSDILIFYRRKHPDASWPSDLEGIRQMPQAELDALVESLTHVREKEDLRTFFWALRAPELRDRISDSARPHERPITSEEFRRFVHRESDLEERFLASELRLSRPDFPLGDDVEIVDLPGTDADDPWAKELSERYVKGVDALLLVSEADQIFGEAGANLLKQIEVWGGDHAERIFVVINKVDVYKGKSSEDIRGAYRQLRSGLDRHLVRGKPRVHYTCAQSSLLEGPALEELTAKLESIVITDDEELDAILGHAKVYGGLEYLKQELDGYLRTRAKDVKVASIESNWSELLQPVLGAVEPLARSAYESLHNQDRRVAEVAENELKGILSRARTGAKAFATDSQNVVTRIGDKTGLLPRLHGIPELILRVELEEGYPRESLQETCRRRWNQLSQAYQQRALEAVQTELLRDFTQELEDKLIEPMRRLSGLRDLLPAADLPQVNPDIIDELLASVELRLAEAYHRRARHLPYVIPPIETDFPSIEKEFNEQLVKFFEGQPRRVGQELQEFLLFYLQWYVNRGQQEIQDFVTNCLDRNLALQYPEAFGSLVSSSDDESGQELLRTWVEIGDEMRRISQTPNPS